MIHWLVSLTSLLYCLSRFAIPCRTVPLKSSHLIDVVKLSFSAAVPAWTSFEKLILLLRKRKKQKYLNQPQNKEFSEQKTFNIYAPEKCHHAACFPWMCFKSSTYTYLLITQGAKSCPRVIALELLSSERGGIAASQFKTNKSPNHLEQFPRWASAWLSVCYWSDSFRAGVMRAIIYSFFESLLEPIFSVQMKCSEALSAPKGSLPLKLFDAN